MLQRCYLSLASAIAFFALPFSWSVYGKNHPVQSFAEHDIKAVYVYRLANFIRWPEGQKNNLVVCTLGKDSTTRSLETLFRQQHAKGHIKAVNSLTDAALQCDLVFVTQDVITQFNPLPQYKGLLTISDSPVTMGEGGMIELRTMNYQVKPVLHLENINNAQLNVSSQLLRIAILVSDQEGEHGHDNE